MQEHQLNLSISDVCSCLQGTLYTNVIKMAINPSLFSALWIMAHTVVDTHCLDIIDVLDMLTPCERVHW
jgi:hypothetical protein